MRKVFLFLILISNFLWADADNGLWVVRHALFQKNAAAHIIDSAKRMGVNKIFVQVFALGRKFYTIPSAPRPDIHKDVLYKLVGMAHKNKIEVHAWLNCFFVYGNKKLPIDPQHIYQRAKGSVLTPFQEAGGDKGVFLYPGDKEYIAELDSVIKEMVEHYNVDGIHLDYFRYPDYGLPLSLSTRTDFELKYFVDPQKVLKQAQSAQQENYRYYKHFVSLYRNFLSQKLTDALIHIKQTVKTLSPIVQLSIAVKPDPIGAGVNYLQSWIKWLKDDLCDFVVVMNYSKNPEIFHYNLRMIDRVALPSKIMIGVGAYNISNRMLYERLKQIKHRGLYKFSLFSYNLLYKNKKLETKIGRLVHGNN